MIEVGSYVMVTTEHRGVFFGKLVREDEDKRIAEIDEAQNCVSWDESQHGVFGLASIGPGGECRIGPAMPKQVLYKVAQLCVVTDEAAKKWKACPWRS